jgi:hypothetical protein
MELRLPEPDKYGDQLYQTHEFRFSYALPSMILPRIDDCYQSMCYEERMFS